MSYQNLYEDEKPQQINWIKLVFVLIFIFGIFIFLVWILPNVSSIEDDQLVFCEIELNITSFTGCINTWDNITEILNYTIPDPEIVNNTIYVNTTEFIDVPGDCNKTLEDLKEKNRHIEVLAELDSQNNSGLSDTQCNLKVQEGINNYMSLNPIQLGSDISKDEEPDFVFWAFIGFIGFIIAFFVYNKIQKGGSFSLPPPIQVPQQLPPSLPSVPKPPLKQEISKEEPFLGD